jgi:hypothetical protein
MVGAVPGNPPRNDLPAITDESPQPLHVLEIDDQDFVQTELTDLLPTIGASLLQHAFLSFCPGSRD